MTGPFARRRATAAPWCRDLLLALIAGLTTACIQPTSPAWENPADDRDQDGVPASADCDDFDPKLGTGVCPRCGDGIHTGPGCAFCVDAVKAGAKCELCADPMTTGAKCDVCVDPLKKGAKCDVCVDPVKTGAKCDVCLDAQRTGGACDQFLGMVLIPAGTFWMGCNAAKDSKCRDNETPQHKVALSAYYIDVTETTVAQYKACVDAGVCTVPADGAYATYPNLPNHPVNNATWTQAEAYCKWRGAAFDLPTEAQWEMAARGSCEKNGSTAGNVDCAAAMRTYPWGEAAPGASYAVSGSEGTAAVGSIPAGDSPFGLHDMSGNVWEWNRDGYGAYGASEVTDPVGPGSASYRVFRGGSFNFDAASLRAGNRDFSYPSYAGPLGLRCVRSFP